MTLLILHVEKTMIMILILILTRKIHIAIIKKILLVRQKRLTTIRIDGDRLNVRKTVPSNIPDFLRCIKEDMHFPIFTVKSKEHRSLSSLAGFYGVKVSD